MTTMDTCVICHERPPTEGFQLCDRCKGFDPLSDSKEIPAAERHANTAPTESALELCKTCGGLVEPYKVGRAVITKGECRTCYHRRRYGPNWKPGGQTKEEKASKCKAWREKKKMEKNGNGNGPEAPDDTGPPEVQAEAVAMLDSIKAGQAEQAITVNTVSGALAIQGIKHITISFIDDDEAMYQRLKDIATYERRSMEQQVLYFLDRVIEV